MRAPNCLGFFDNFEGVDFDDSEDSDSETRHDGSLPSYRFGLVFEKPRGAQGIRNIISLQALISDQPCPTLTRRIELAKALAHCLLSLHSVNWLHKGFRTDNVLYYQAAQGMESIDWAAPLISGFEYARPSLKDEMTELPSTSRDHNLYRHPDAQGAQPSDDRIGFRKSFDIYSLGIVLIEIALWRGIAGVLNIIQPKLKNTKIIRSRLLEDHGTLNAVAASMGERYYEATRCCITGPLGLGLESLDNETDDVASVKLMRNFFEKVVLRLNEIRT